MRRRGPGPGRRTERGIHTSHLHPPSPVMDLRLCPCRAALLAGGFLLFLLLVDPVLLAGRRPPVVLGKALV